jgi:hypothetical protein
MFTGESLRSVVDVASQTGLLRVSSALQPHIEAFIHELRTMYERTYRVLEPGYPGVISFVAWVTTQLPQCTRPHNCLLHF